MHNKPLVNVCILWGKKDRPPFVHIWPHFNWPHCKNPKRSQMNTVFLWPLHGKFNFLISDWTFWHQLPLIPDETFHYNKINKMKIIHKKKKKSLRCNFLPLNKSIKSTLFSPPHSSADHRGRCSVLCAKRLFSTAVWRFYVLERPRLSRSLT